MTTQKTVTADVRSARERRRRKQKGGAFGAGGGGDGMGAGGATLDWEGVAAPLPALTTTAAAACGALEALLTVRVFAANLCLSAALRPLEHSRASPSRKLSSVPGAV